MIDVEKLASAPPNSKEIGGAHASGTQDPSTGALVWEDLRKDPPRPPPPLPRDPVEPRGFSGGGGRRTKRRERIRAHNFGRRVHAALALAVFSGPVGRLSPTMWRFLRDRAQSGLLALVQRLERDPSAGDAFCRLWECDPPKWACALLQASNLRRDVESFETLLSNNIILDSSERFCRGSGHTDGASDKSDREKIAEQLYAGGYSANKAKQDRIFRKINPEFLDIPKVGARLLNPLDFTEEIFTRLFSEENLRRCMVPVRKDIDKIKGHCSLNLDDGVSKLDLYQAISHLCYLSVDEEYLHAENNGVFALLKKVVDEKEVHRLIFDLVRGNRHFSLAKLQEIFAELVVQYPEAAAKMRCTAKMMNICSPHDVAFLPPGATSVSSSDLRNFFYQWRTLPFLEKFQGLFFLRGEEVGMPENEWVKVGARTLPMGGWASALIAHSTHACILSRGLVFKPIRLILPAHASKTHREDLAFVVELAKKEKDGMVAWTQVPARMRRSFVESLPNGKGTGSARLDDLRLPPCALAVEPATEVHGRDPKEYVVLRTEIMGGDHEARGDVLRNERDNRRGRVAHFFLALIILYQDDTNTLLWEPPADTHSPAARAGAAVAATHRLLSVLVADEVGLLQHHGKLRWPNQSAELVLGIVFEFFGGDRRLIRFAVSAERRRRISDELLSMVIGFFRGRIKLVNEKYLESLVGELTWSLLIRRCLLGALDITYKALRSPNRPAGQIIITAPLANEWFMVAGLLVFAENYTKNFSSTLWAFDACGKSKWGQGGHATVYRRGITDEMATELTTPTQGARLSQVRIIDGAAPPDRLANPRRRKTINTAVRFLQCSWNKGTDQWKVAREGEFKVAPRIVTKAESVSGKITFHCAKHDPRSIGALVAIAGDNQPSLAGFVKGRTGIRDLQNVQSEVAASQILLDIEPKWFWVNSEAMPADEPSRRYIERKRRRTHRSNYQSHAPRPLPRRTEREWIEDVSATSGEARVPGPYHPVIKKHLELERRAFEAAGPPALAIPNSRNREPYKGVLPAAQELVVSLGFSKLGVPAQRNYVKGWCGFSFFVKERWYTRTEYADLVTDFVEFIFKSGEATRTTATQVLCFLPYIAPDAKQLCAMAWKAWGAWGKKVPKKSWPPLPRCLALLFALRLLESTDPHDVDTGLALLIAYHVYARGGEVDALSVKDVIGKLDPRALARKTQVLFRKTKGGRPQMVVVDSDFIDKVMEFAVRRAQEREPTDHNPLMFKFGSGGFMQRFKRIQVACGYPVPFFVRHSCRHGPATEEFILRARSEVEISTRLRHIDAKTTKIYLQDSVVSSLLAELPEEVVRSLESYGSADNMVWLIAQKLGF